MSVTAGSSPYKDRLLRFKFWRGVDETDVVRQLAGVEWHYSSGPGRPNEIETLYIYGRNTPDKPGGLVDGWQCPAHDERRIYAEPYLMAAQGRFDACAGRLCALVHRQAPELCAESLDWFLYFDLELWRRELQPAGGFRLGLRAGPTSRVDLMQAWRTVRSTSGPQAVDLMDQAAAARDAGLDVLARPEIESLLAGLEADLTAITAADQVSVVTR